MPSEARHVAAPLNGRQGRRSLLRETDLRVGLHGHSVTDHVAADACCALFVTGMQRQELRHVEQRTFPRDGSKQLDGIELLGRVEISWRDDDSHGAVLGLREGPLALLSVYGGQCETIVAASSRGAAGRASDWLETILRVEGAAEQGMPVTFWCDSPNGPLGRRKSIETPEWEDIEHNYSAAARDGLQELMSARAPGAGALVLWHGPPGTGKSHALRALAHRWRDWCSAHYITDPESFLGRGTSYLMQVAVEHDEKGRDGEPRWRLIVLEDAGELISVNARRETGQALSRLLNVADGLLGQGGRCLLLITTNEPVGRLHAAVRRPGRCWSRIEFGELSVPEAAAWLAQRGSDAPIRRPTPLAELYAILESRELEAPEAEPFGFGVR